MSAHNYMACLYSSVTKNMLHKQKGTQNLLQKDKQSILHCVGHGTWMDFYS